MELSTVICLYKSQNFNFDSWWRCLPAPENRYTIQLDTEFDNDFKLKSSTDNNAELDKCLVKMGTSIFITEAMERARMRM